MGLLDSLTGNSGLFGLGGASGMMNPAVSLLGNSVDQSAMRNYTLKNMLLGAGIGLLNQGPSLTPINFGTTLGQGLASGLTAGQAAQKDYLNNVMEAQRMKMLQQQMQLQQNADARAQGLYEPQLKAANLDVTSKQATQDALAGAPPVARIVPEAWATRQLGPAPEFKQTGTGPYGNPIFGWTPPYPGPNGQTQAAQQQSSMAQTPPVTVTLGQDGKPNPDEQAAFVDTLPPELKTLIPKIGNYEVDINKLVQQKGGTRAYWENLASLYNPNYKSYLYPQIAAEKSNWGVHGKVATTLQSAGMALEHLNTYLDSVDAMNNPNSGAYGPLTSTVIGAKNAWKGGESNPDLAAMSVAADGVGSELAKVFKGTGSNDVSSINEWRKNVGTNLSKDAQYSAAKTAVEMLAGRFNAAAQQYKAITGEDPPVPSFLTPKGVQAMKRLGLMPKDEFNGANAPDVNSPNQSSAANGGDPLSQARAAIAAGADPAKVKARLQQNGIDPSGL